MDLTPLVTERALELGFLAVGYVPVGPLDHAPHLRRWLDDGFHGEMEWMARHAALRADTALLEPGMRTVIALAAPYDAGAPGDDPAISRYARGPDYHDVLRARVRELGAFVRAETGAEVALRPAVDSAPVLERAVAIEAGIGWLGKSAMVLRQGVGSWFFLAELFVDVELGSPARAHPDRCGRCTRCIDACPTGAIVAPYRIDARRCISYLTIELRGPIPRALRPGLGHRLFGCDVCQAVCPWNTFAAPPALPGLEPRPEVAAATARELLTMDETTFRARFRDTPLWRTRRRGLARNAAVVLGNLGERDAAPLLSEALARDPEPLVRGHAAWALGRIGGVGAAAALRRGCKDEPDDYVREEMRLALTGTGAEP